MFSKLKSTLLISAFLGTSFSSYAAPSSAWRTLVNNRGNVRSYPAVVQDLVKDGLYFTSVPYLKEYLSRGGSGSKLFDKLLDEVISNVGVRQFEVLPRSILQRSNAPTIHYLLAKKAFRVGDYAGTLRQLNGTIPADHPTKPFALFLEASAFSITKKHKSAVASYKRCVSVSKSMMRSYETENRLRQLAINRDYCLVGIARTQFAAQAFEAAQSSYLDLSKDSFIWPEILFEEAWNSFYQRDFNRTLGKLVTYKAPVLDYSFNPEVEVLKALTYMELCLWTDTQKVVNGFYQSYQKDYLLAKKFMRRNGKNYKYYYLLGKSLENGKASGNQLINRLTRSVVKDAAYRELREYFNLGKREIEILKGLPAGKMRKVFTQNLREALVLQRDLVGAYLRKGIQLHLDQMEKAFEGMSYIKLEVLSKRKDQIYDVDSLDDRERGDIKYLTRTEKQYFWTFNGEFWADELGDYVFSLKSECE